MELKNTPWMLQSEVYIHISIAFFYTDIDSFMTPFLIQRNKCWNVTKMKLCLEFTPSQWLNVAYVKHARCMLLRS
jgi:hypothetical protein